MKHRSPSLSRRRFLGGILAASAAPMIVPASVLGRDGKVAPSNRVTVAGIGVGNRARNVIPNFIAQEDVQFMAAADCRADRLAAAKKLIDDNNGNTDCVIYADFQEVLARDDIDAVFIATGNRWHALASIYASRAGKDIYCEKPISLTPREGRTLVETTQRYGTIYQAGHQRRSVDSYKFMRDVVQKGMIGNVHTVEMQVWTGDALPHQKPEAIPAGWDWDRWLGQTPYHAFTPNRAFRWQYFWDTAEGMLTDMGCHYTDLMQFTLDRDETGPVSYEGKAQFPDPKIHMSDTPITAEVHATYADGLVCKMYQREGFTDRYIKFIGDEDFIRVDDHTNVVTASPASILKQRSVGAKSWSDAGGHIRNLLTSMRTRALTAAHPESAHRAITICQAMNICLRLGRKLQWDPVAETFDDPDANRMLWREQRAPWRL